MADNFVEKRPVISFLLFFVIFLAIRLAFEWSELRANGVATIAGAVVYAVGFGLLMVLLPRFSKMKT